MQDKCPECTNNRELGHRFCGSCGNMLDCPECGRYRSVGTLFCGNCGRPLRPGPAYISDVKGNGPVFWISLAAMLFVTVFLVVGLATILINSFNVFSYAADITYGLLILVPYPYVFLWFSGIGSQMYWIFLVAAVVLSFAQLAWEMYSKHVNRGPDGGARGLEDTSAYWIGLLWPSTIAIQVAIILLMMSGGSSLPSFDTSDDKYWMFALASASVWEEVITRLLIIGLPLGIMALATKKERPLRYLLGGFGVNKASMVLIIASSLLFGYGHYDGWGVIKILPSFIFGLAAGYLYCKYGLYASILLHFVNDYMQSFLWLGLDASLFSILVIALLGLGVVTTVVLAVKGVSFAKGFMERELFPDSFKKD